MGDDRVATATGSTRSITSAANSGAPILKPGQPTSAMNLDQGGLQPEPNLVSNTQVCIHTAFDLLSPLTAKTAVELWLSFVNKRQVTWDGPDDPEHPKNWTARRKWLSIVPVSLFNFLASVSSSTMAPALGTIGRELHFQSTTLLILSLSVFLLDAHQIGSGVNADLFRPHERGKAIAVYVMAPLLGGLVGPIAGGFLDQYVSWPWCFYVISIAGGAVQVLGLPFFHETYAPVLLQRKCKRLKKSTNNPDLYTEHDSVSLQTLLRTSAIRPFKLLATQPIVQVWSLYCAYIWGILYLIIATFPDVWTDIYGESIAIGSLNYISQFEYWLGFIRRRNLS
ncbi:hypothetical protein SLS64_009213 [Diaporthe eres]